VSSHCARVAKDAALHLKRGGIEFDDAEASEEFLGGIKDNRSCRPLEFSPKIQRCGRV